MNSAESSRPVLRVMLTWASLVVIIAGMKAAAALVVPFLLALFLAIMSGPALQSLNKRGVPQWLAMLLVLAGLCVVVVGLATVIGTTINQFVEEWPQKYQPRIGEIMDGWNNWIDRIVVEWKWISQFGIDEWVKGLKIDDSDSGKSHWLKLIEPGAIMQVFLTSTLAVSGLLSQTLLILITTLFLLVEATTLPQKMQQIASGSTSHYGELQQIAEDVNSYMAIKTSTSLITGVIVTISLWLLGIDFALLWGLTAFLLNYVPNIGSILAAVPAVLLTLLQYGFGTAAVVVSLYVTVNMIIGYFIEPRWMGKGLGLSTLVVFLSLVFWGWVLGPVGMIISVPLTMTVKIALENSDDTRWLAILMGSGTSPNESTS